MAGRFSVKVLRADAKTAWGSLKLPSIKVTLGDFAASALAEAEVVLRVKARMLKEEADGEARRDVMRAPPCLPVAPVIRRVRGESIVLVVGLDVMLVTESRRSKPYLYPSQAQLLRVRAGGRTHVRDIFLVNAHPMSSEKDGTEF